MKSESEGLSKLNTAKLTLITIIILIGGFLRFYKLNWGNNYFFHPDEYHIAAAVAQIHFPNQMNPKLFTYGSMIVYPIYFTKTTGSLIIPSLSTTNSILIGRFYSALLSTFTIVLVFLIAKMLTDSYLCSTTSAFIYAILPGAVQQAHFTTPESFITFWLMLNLYLIMVANKNDNNRYLYYSAISFGAAVATKVSVLSFTPVLLVSPFFGKDKPIIKSILIKLFRSIKLFFVTLITTFLFFPYIFLDYKDFISSMKYETGVGVGSPIVFYTRQFINTTPIVFQFTKILPFTLGPAIMIVGLAGFLLMLIKLTRRRSRNRYLVFVVLFSFLLLFLTNAFLFAKWTRFIAPTFPLWCISSGYLLNQIIKKNSKKINYYLGLTVLILVVFTTSIWSLMFFSVYQKSDVRITASGWINKNIPQNQFIFTETGNTLEVPLYGAYTKEAFDFYNLESNYDLENSLVNYLSTSDYFIIQSRRLFINHLRIPKQYPEIANFYTQLFSGKLGYTEIKEFNSFPELKLGVLDLKINDEPAEETWSVFDHPVIRIYQKTTPHPKEYYAKILKI